NMNTVLTPAQFCGQNGSTNYAAAFKSAQQALQSSTGSRTIYFITDGQPQLTGDRDPQAEQDGLTAAQALKTALPNVAINAIFLQPSTAAADPDFDPQAYLTQITGSADKVRLVSAAADLAGEILKFGFPELDVVENTAKGIIKVDASTNLGSIQI